MNNLAQSALQLQWYRKAETFCTMALEYFAEQQQPTQQVDVTHSEQLSKLYFRRGKARKYRGEYQAAKTDYERALKLVSNEFERKVIQTELRNVQEKAKEAKQNQRQQKESLQQVMMKKHSNKSDGPNRGVGIFNTPSVPSRKAYSTLRAPRRSQETVHKREQQHNEERQEKEEDLLLQLSFWEYYLAMAGRVASYFLRLLGDEDGGNQANKSSNRKNILVYEKVD
jgi:tetratricopeptide (TPR) repeat protein